MCKPEYAKLFLCCALLCSAFKNASTVQAQTVAWRAITIAAPAQIVEVETRSQAYQAYFQHETVLYPNGRATGGLWLTAPDGSARQFLVYGGQAKFRDGQIWRVRLRLRQVSPMRSEELTLVIYPEQTASEDCLIYTTVGTEVYGVTFDAPGRLTVVR